MRFSLPLPLVFTAFVALAIASAGPMTANARPTPNSSAAAITEPHHAPAITPPPPFVTLPRYTVQTSVSFKNFPLAQNTQSYAVECEIDRLLPGRPPTFYGDATEAVVQPTPAPALMNVTVPVQMTIVRNGSGTTGEAPSINVLCSLFSGRFVPASTGGPGTITQIQQSAQPTTATIVTQPLVLAGKP